MTLPADPSREPRGRDPATVSIGERLCAGPPTRRPGALAGV